MSTNKNTINVANDTRWTGRQIEALAFEGNLCLLAGAGSGKTLTLVELVRRLLDGRVLGERLDITQILAMTYTEKAAREMRDRIRLSLNKNIKHSQEPERSFWVRQRRLLDRAQISTIHSFCLQVLRQYGLEAGQDPDFSIVDDEREFKANATREAILDWIQDEDQDLLDLLDYFPWIGRGRQTGLDRILNLIGGRSRVFGRPVSPGSPEETPVGPHIAALRQSAETITSLVEAGKIKPDKKYYHTTTTFAAAVWETAGPDRTEAEILEAAPKLEALVYGNWFSAKNARETAKEALEVLTAELYRRRSMPLKEKLQKLSLRLEAALTDAKRQRQALDFDDLLLKTRRILAERPDVRTRLKERYRVVLVDEFQDTNRLQADILAYLTEPTDQNRSYEPETPAGEILPRAPKRLVVLGDPKQSIYRFRGAEVRVFNAIKSSIAQEDHRGVVALDTNFRSQKRLVDFFNQFFQTVMPPGFLPNTEFGPDDRQQWHRADLTGGPGAFIMNVSKGNSAAEDRRIEAEALARYLEKAFSGGMDILVGEEGRRPEPGDAAVLLRRFTHLKVYEQAFRDRDLPYYTLRGKGFYQCREVLDLINFLSYLADLSLSPALLGVLRSPLFGLSDDTLTRLAWPPGGEAYRDPIDYFKEDPHPWPDGLDREQIVALEMSRDIIIELSHRAGYAYPADIIEDLIEKTDYLSILAAGYQGEQKVANVQRFIEVTRRLPIRALYSPGEMSRFFQGKLRDFQGDPEAQVSAEGAGAIQIMTIHQAKGLQFPIVLVPDAGSMPRLENRPVIFDSRDRMAIRMKDLDTQQTNVPLDYRHIKDESDRLDWAEHYRLLYVAATRAQDLLVFSGSPDDAKKDNWLDKLLPFSEKYPNLLSQIDPEDPMVEADETGTAEAVSTENTTADFSIQETDGSETGLESRRIIQRVLKPKPARPSFFNINVTGLAQYLACPRRYYLESIVGLPEITTASEDRESVSGMTPREIGIILHYLMETIDLTGTVEIASLSQRAMNRAEEEGWNMQPELASDIAGLVLEFLESPWGGELKATAGRGLIQRECPVWLRIETGNGDRSKMILTGEIDLFFIPQNGPARIVDYKYAHPKEAGRYEPQLKAYALALVRAGLTRNLKAGLYFTGEAGAKAVEIPLLSGWVEAFETLLGTTARDIQNMFASDGFEPPPQRDCPGEACGFYYACR